MTIRFTIRIRESVPDHDPDPGRTGVRRSLGGLCCLSTSIVVVVIVIVLLVLFLLHLVLVLLIVIIEQCEL